MPTIADLTSWIILAQAENGGAPNGGGGLFGGFGMWLPLVVIFLLFYVLLIRPQRRKQADLAAMLGNLKKNDRVVTIGGIFGTIVNVQKDSEEVTVRVDDDMRLRMLRSSIARVVSDKDPGDKQASLRT